VKVHGTTFNAADESTEEGVMIERGFDIVKA
jgi:hypothetical protein